MALVLSWKGSRLLFTADQWCTRISYGIVRSRSWLLYSEHCAFCIVFHPAYLNEYLDRTQGLRNGDKCLFISYVKPHRAVSRDTISRWAKSVLESSGIDSHKFAPHSSRAAAAARAKQHVPLDVILAHVGWRSDETFRKFYNKPVIPANNIIASAILSQ